MNISIFALKKRFTSSVFTSYISMKIAYVRTGGRGGGGPDQCVRTAYRGRVKNWQTFAYVLYGWPLILSRAKIALMEGGAMLPCCAIVLSNLKCSKYHIILLMNVAWFNYHQHHSYTGTHAWSYNFKEFWHYSRKRCNSGRSNIWPPYSFMFYKRE